MEEDTLVPVVSVVCMTYNQADYIRRALDSFLMQKTTFPFEILVHDDASNDGTQDILREYEVKHDCIRVFFEEENQFSQLPAGDHFKQSLEPYARGKYIAQCEGDDYWTDSEKLQRQFEFMENHPEYVCCGHRTKKISEDGFQDLGCIGLGENPCDVTSEMVVQDIPIHTSSIFYRRGLGKEFMDDWHIRGAVMDFPWALWLCEKGPVHYDPREMSAYRVMSKGSYSSESKKDKQLANNIHLIELCDELNERTNGKYDSLLAQRKKTYAIIGAVLGGNAFLERYDSDRAIRRHFNLKDRLFIFLQSMKKRV